MIRRILLTLMLLCSLSLLANVRVLSVCVSTYPASGGWSAVSARNDNRSIKAIFPDAVSLIDNRATYAAFVEELDKLKNNVMPGDTVIIHFSGHGQQIITPASTSEPDHVDEALVPYDALKRKTISYKGQNHFTDNTFGKHISAIRDKAGRHGLVITVIDACHSDSMDKGQVESDDDVYRGTDEIFGAENLSPDSIMALQELYHQRDKSVVDTSTDMADAIFISACRTDQRNYEIKINGESHGSLTFYFCKAVNEKGLANTEEMLSYLDSQMTNDKVMKFHGQRPNIRTSFGWTAPSGNTDKPSSLPQPDEPTSSNLKLWIMVGLGVIIILTVVIILWKKKR